MASENKKNLQNFELKRCPTMPKCIFIRKKTDFVNSYIFLQVLHNDASSTLNIDPIYCTCLYIYISSGSLPLRQGWRQVGIPPGATQYLRSISWEKSSSVWKEILDSYCTVQEPWTQNWIITEVDVDYRLFLWATKMRTFIAAIDWETDRKRYLFSADEFMYLLSRTLWNSNARWCIFLTNSLQIIVSTTISRPKFPHFLLRAFYAFRPFTFPLYNFYVAYLCNPTFCAPGHFC